MGRARKPALTGQLDVHPGVDTTKPFQGSDGPVEVQPCFDRHLTASTEIKHQTLEAPQRRQGRTQGPELFQTWQVHEPATKRNQTSMEPIPKIQWQKDWQRFKNMFLDASGLIVFIYTQNSRDFQRQGTIALGRPGSPSLSMQVQALLPSGSTKNR